MASSVMPDLVLAKEGIFDWYPLLWRIAACAAMTKFRYLSAGAIADPGL
jgi:hypothetical protein